MLPSRLPRAFPPLNIRFASSRTLDCAPRLQSATPTRMSSLGDMDPEAFRKEAHRIADWIADYFAAPERYPVLSRVRPGEIREALPASAPGVERAVRADLRGLRAHPAAGHHPLESSRVLRLFRDLRERTWSSRGVPLRGAERPGDVVAHVAGGDRARGGHPRVAAPAHRTARSVRGSDLRHRLDLDPPRARRRTRACGDRRSRDAGSRADSIWRRFASTARNTRTRRSTRP